MSTQPTTEQLINELIELGDFTDFTLDDYSDVKLVEDEGLVDALDMVYGTWATHAPLIRVLTAALAQSATGKGLERHGTLAPHFHDQPIHRIADLLGGDGYVGHLFQALKKIVEAKAMLDSDMPDARNRAIRELLGAIVYLAAASDRIGGGR